MHVVIVAMAIYGIISSVSLHGHLNDLYLIYYSLYNELQ